MNIQGLDYNTQREKLILPEYGREVQKMVEHCLTIEDRAERQICAETIVKTMKNMCYPNNNSQEVAQKLWDHLAIMADFKLDIDYPFDIEQAAKIYEKPAPLKYPKKKIPQRHYGAMMFEMFEKLKTMEPGKERDELVKLTVNQMRRCLDNWGQGCKDNEKIAADLEKFTGIRPKL